MNDLKSTRVCLIVLMLLALTETWAQLAPQYTQYMYNTSSFNTAYVGTVKATEITGAYRAQWVGVDGAPKTFSLSINHPMAKKNAGIGLSIIQDNIGPSSQTMFKAQYAYKVNLSKEVLLSFGVDAGGSLLNVDFGKGDFLVQTDGSINQNTINKFYATIGVGTFLYAKNWYIGMSVPNVLTSNVYNDEVKSLVPNQILVNLIAGMVFDLNANLKFKPALLFNHMPEAQSNLNLSANFLYANKFIVGGSYRFGSAFSGMLGFQASKRFFVGYAYDYDTTGLGNHNSGSHEIIWKFNFQKKKAKQIHSPRFF